MKKITFLTLILVLLSACSPITNAPQSGKKTIVVTYSILGAVVRDLVGDQATLIVLMPNGQDPHEWDPSAKDIEIMNKADLTV